MNEYSLAKVQTLIIVTLGLLRTYYGVSLDLRLTYICFTPSEMEHKTVISVRFFVVYPFARQ